MTLVYDAECGFCVRSLRVVRALDVLGVCRYLSSRDDRALQRFPMLAGSDLDEAMYAVTGSGRVYRGFFAFRRAALSLPLAWPLLLLFYFPGAELAGPAVYRWIAANRRRLDCSSTCDLPVDSPARKTGQPLQ